MSNVQQASTHELRKFIYDIFWEGEWPGLCQDIDDSMVIVFDPIDRQLSWEFAPKTEHTHVASVTIKNFEVKYFCTFNPALNVLDNVILVAMGSDMSLQVYGDVDCPSLGRRCVMFPEDEDLDRTHLDFAGQVDPNDNEYLEFWTQFHMNHEWPEGLLAWASRRTGATRADFGVRERRRVNRMLRNDIYLLAQDGLLAQHHQSHGDTNLARVRIASVTLCDDQTIIYRYRCL